MLDIKTIEKKAIERFGEGKLFCAESVLAVLSEEAGIESPLIPRIATGFCGGIARTCGLCGAVAGGVIALGAIYGRDNAQQSQEIVYEKVQQFIKVFEKEFKSTNCYELTGCDLSTEEGRQLLAETDNAKKCISIVGTAAGLVAKIINEDN